MVGRVNLVQIDGVIDVHPHVVLFTNMVSETLHEIVQATLYFKTKLSETMTRFLAIITNHSHSTFISTFSSTS